MENIILNGIGKTKRNAYLNGKLTFDEVLKLYAHNKKEADGFDTFGLSLKDLVDERNSTHNPLKRNKLDQIIAEYKKKSENGNAQNKLSLSKLEYYRQSALGLGLRKVLSRLRKMEQSGNKTAEITRLLLDVEFANLTAKKCSRLSKLIYERKRILLEKASTLLKKSNWKCGVSFQPGKNALYIIYVYLPDGEQVSWHTNDYNICNYYDHTDFVWDGLACSTLEKLLSFAHNELGIGEATVEYQAAA